MSQPTGFSPETDDPTVRLIAGLPKVRGYPVIGQYILCSQLGAGGAGAVFMGYHVKLQRQVAVKVLNPAVLNLSDKAIARFEREAILTSQMRSNHIIPVTDAGTVPGTDIHYLVMDLIDGENAEDRVIRRGGAMQVSEALTIIRDATRGLADAHRQETIHRDLKPANIMISATGEVRLADLGIATSFEKPNLMYTQADEFLGTPQYMSPEQIRGDVLDGRTDVYSMGVTLHHLLTGEHPFSGSTAYAVMQRVESESLPDIREYRSDVPDNVASFIQAATQRDRDERIPSSEAMVARLDVLLRKHGEVNLADPDAGGEHRDRCIQIASEELQALMPEMNAATTLARSSAGAQAKPRGRAGAVVMLLLLLFVVGGVGAAGYFVFVNPDNGGTVTPPPPAEAPATLAEQLGQAIAASDVPRIAAVMDEIARNQGDAAQQSNFELVAAWLADGQRAEQLGPIAFLDRYPPDSETILSLVNTSDSATYESWLSKDAAALIQDKRWTDLQIFMVQLAKAEALPGALIPTIAADIYQTMIDAIRQDGLDAIDEPAKQLMRYMADTGQEQFEPPLKLIDRLASSQMSVALLDEWYGLAGQLGLREQMREAILDEAGQLLGEDAADRAGVIRLLQQIAGDDPGSADRVVAMLMADTESSIARRDWPMTTAGMQALFAIKPGNTALQTRLGNAAVASIADAARYDATGTVHIPGQGLDPLLALLMDRGIADAGRWRVELQVTWANGEDIMDFRVNTTSNAFGELLVQARNGSDDDALTRLLFIAYDHTRWIRVKSETLTREQVRSNLFSNCSRAIPAGNADSAARYVFDCHFAQSFIPQSEKIDYWPAAMTELGFDPPLWSQLAGNLKAAAGLGRGDLLVGPSYWQKTGLLLVGPSANRRGGDRYINRRAQFWLAWGSIWMGNDGEPIPAAQLQARLTQGDDSIRALFEHMLVAAEWGYAPNKATEVIRYTRDHVESNLPPGQTALTKTQQFRLNRLERSYPR